MKKIYAVGNTHFDPVWLWTLDEAMISIRSTFKSALERMKEYPEFKYSFSCPPVFEWLKETDGELFGEIQKAVERGQWDLCEGWWLQSDCNAPSGESLVRQGIYGQRYLMENFNRRAECVFNSDSFGHSAMMPQILAKSGIKYYAFSRPDETEEELPGQLFKWQSADGSAVTAYRIISGHSPEIEKSVEEISGRLKESNNGLMLVYGVTNHGGAPTKKAIEYLSEWSESGAKVEFSSVEDYFKSQEKKELPAVQGELQVKHFGVFINNPKVKRLNKKCETVLLNAEKAAVLAGMYGKEYPAAKLNESWRDLLFNQFHDIIGGACTKNVYFDARNVHGRALADSFEVLNQSLQYISKDIKAESPYWNIVAFNLNDNPYSGVVEAEVQWLWEFEAYKGGIELADGDGKIYECQIVRELSVIDGFRSRFAFNADIPPMGYKVFELRKHSDKRQYPGAGGKEFINNLYKIEYDENTRGIAITRIEDNKKFSGLFTPYVLEDEGDTWAFNVKGFGNKKEYFDFVSSQVIEHGEVKSTLKITLKYNESTLDMYYTAYNRCDYVDLKYIVNWREKHKVLKFNVADSRSNTVNCGVPYGNIERPRDGREYPLSDYIKTEAFTVLCDGIFSYSAEEENIGLSVLRSPVAGDLRLALPLDEAADYDYISNDINEGYLRFVPGRKNTAGAASDFFNPPVIAVEPCHDGKLEKENGFLRLNAQSVKLSAMKKAENGRGVVLRLHEYAGKEQELSLSGFSLKDCKIRFKPYEIKTLEINGSNVTETDFLEEKI